jgi:ATP-dependent Zn protease
MLARNGDSYSEEIKEKIDGESLALVTKALEDAKNILLQNRCKLDNLVDELIKKTTLNGNEFENILNTNNCIITDDDCECSV